MSASQFKGLLGILMGLSGAIIPLIPPPYQWIAMTLVGLFGGGHAVTSATVTDPKK